jgi:hypothetical protein
MKDAITAWNACVKKAKKKVPGADKFTLIKGPLLKEAQKAYCSMGF